MTLVQEARYPRARPVRLDAAGAPGWRQVARRFRRHRLPIAGVAFLVLLSTACVVGPHFAPAPNSIPLTHIPPPSAPSWRHWFGTDELGRDVLARVLAGGRTSLEIAFGVALLATTIGTVVGCAAGYYRGRLDDVLMRVVDLLLVIPLLPVTLVAASIARIGPLVLTAPGGLIVVLAGLSWALPARVVRGSCLGVREADFVAAARSVGSSDLRVLTRHILPNVAGPVIVNATLVFAQAILVESALSFLGFGVKLPNATWGSMITTATSTMQVWPWMTVFPGLAIFLTVLAVSAVGDGLRDALDPTESDDQVRG